MMTVRLPQPIRCHKFHCFLEEVRRLKKTIMPPGLTNFNIVVSGIVDFFVQSSLGRWIKSIGSVRSGFIILLPAIHPIGRVAPMG